MSQRSSTNHARLKSGFTLLELLVSIGLMLIIISVVLSGQSTYTKRASLRNLANDIALTVRQAQVYGTSVQGFRPVAGSAEFTNAYGVHFNISNNVDPAAKTVYTFFADRPQNGQPKNQIYDSGPSCPPLSTNPDSECIERSIIPGGNQIDDICLITLTGGFTCSNNSSISGVNVTFLRPETSANLVFMGNSGNALPFCTQAQPCKGVRIKLLSPTGNTSTVDIYKTGQISIN
ncbi:MAG: type II secretion system protein [Patescibacteria group bacterium]